MKENQMHLISKMFKSETIRTVWNKEEQKYYISVVDIVGILSESKNKQLYWRKLKQRGCEWKEINLEKNFIVQATR